MPAHKPTDQQRAMVRALVTAGLTQDRTAAVIGINKSTLIKHYKKELEGARDEALGRNTVALMQMANKGNAAAAIYLQKCLGGREWNERNGPGTGNNHVEGGVWQKLKFTFTPHAKRRKFLDSKPSGASSAQVAEAARRLAWRSTR